MEGRLSLGSVMAKGSTLLIVVALAGNLAIALAKFVASWISESTALLTEAIHSLVDTGDQVLLLVGQKRGARPPDGRHPLGHGMGDLFLVFHRRSDGLSFLRRAIA